MKRESIVALLLALLVVVARGGAAAPLDTAVTTNGGGFGGGPVDGAGGEEAPDETGFDSEPGGAMDLSLGGVCYPWLAEPPALLALFGLLLLIGWFGYRETESLFAAGVIAGTVFLPIGLVWAVLTACRDVEFDPQVGLADDDGDAIFGPGGGAPGVGNGDGVASTPEAVFLIVVVLALLASLLVLLATRGDDADDGALEAGGRDERERADPDLSAVGRAAGAAADRIEVGDAENEVYRAWREMTEVLDVDRPASSTPGEFATAAIDAGVAREPVERLTDVFERVRYGGADPTGDRERQAVEALRRIEAAHSDTPSEDRPIGGDTRGEER